jgi:surface protein
MEPSFVNQNVADHVIKLLECGICLERSVAPVETPCCGRVFCKPCFDQLPCDSQKRVSCPSCLTEIGRESVRTEQSYVNPHHAAEVIKLQQCSICSKRSDPPVDVPCCGKVFCQACLDALLVSQKGLDGIICPCCREVIARASLRVSRALQEQYNRLLVHCHYSKNGCIWQGAVVDQNDHTTNCRYQDSSLPLVLQVDIQVAHQKLRLPLSNGTVCSVCVEWGDGTPDNAYTRPGEIVHIFQSVGRFVVKVWPHGESEDGVWVDMFGYSADRQQREWQIDGREWNHVTEITQLGKLGITSLRALFYRCTNVPTLRNWDTSNVTDMHAMFYHASTFNQPLASWDTSNVIDMSDMFRGAVQFNHPIGSWDTSNVTDISRMFYNSTTFNQPIGTWNTRNVTNMLAVFYNAKAFDQPIGSWNTKHVTDMSYMFRGAESFNQPIGSWKTSNVTDMYAMFCHATAFNQVIDRWIIDKVTTTAEMFAETDAFNQPICSWNTSNVTDMSNMFRDAAAFNKPIDSWDTSNVMDMSWMFHGTTAFNQPIGSWNTGKVTTMSHMFHAAKAFNQPIGSWDTSKVMNMSGMFEGAAAFNCPIGSWNINNEVNMYCMFQSAASFDQYLHGFKIDNLNRTTWHYLSTEKTSALYAELRRLRDENSALRIFATELEKRVKALESK